MRTTWKLNVELLVTIGFLSACFAFMGKSYSEPLEVTIGYSPIRISLPVMVANSAGLFEKEGLKVSLERHDSPQPVMESLASGRLKAGGYIAFPILFSLLARSDVQLCAATSMIEDKDHLFLHVVSRTPGQEPSRLRGKRIAIMNTVAIRQWWQAIAKANGLQTGDYSILPMAPNMLVTAFRGGQVDAVVAPDPISTALLADGAFSVGGPKHALYQIFSEPFAIGTFVFDCELLQTSPRIVHGIVRALDGAIDLIHADQHKAKELMATYLSPAEKAVVAKFPNSRYLRSEEVTQAFFSSVEAQSVVLGAAPISKRIRVYPTAESR